MGQLSVFNFTSLDGYYKGPGGDISWHNHDEEGQRFSIESMKPGNTLVFGRVTYEMMAGFWPSAAAIENMPEVAAGMNEGEKIVFSKTMQKLKKTPGKHMTILGSGSLVSQLGEAGLIDEYLFMVDPIALGGGTPIFAGIGHPVRLKLVSNRAFKNGAVLLGYEPA
jgi:dihydrofolate reductase